MSDHKEMKQTLKSPDKFQVAMAEVLDWMLANKNLLIGTGVALVVVLVGMFSWGEYSTRQTLKLRNALSTIEIKYQDEESKVADQRRDLQNKIADIDAKAMPADGADKTKKTELSAQDKAAKESLEKMMTALKADHSASLGEYTKFFDANASKAEGWIAGFRAVSIMIAQKKYDEARALVTRLADLTAKNPTMQFGARMTLIGLLEEGGKLADALKVCDQLVASAPEDLKAQAMLAKARLQLSNNAKEDARKTLDDIISKHAQSQEADRARSMKALMF